MNNLIIFRRRHKTLITNTIFSNVSCGSLRGSNILNLLLIGSAYMNILIIH